MRTFSLILALPNCHEYLPVAGQHLLKSIAVMRKPSILHVQFKKKYHFTEVGMVEFSKTDYIELGCFFH